MGNIKEERNQERETEGKKRSRNTEGKRKKKVIKKKGKKWETRGGKHEKEAKEHKPER